MLKLFLLFLIVNSVLFTELLFSDLLKNSKLEILEAERNEGKAKGDLTKNLWLGGINLEASYNWFDAGKKYDDDFPKFTATIFQDIFRSGGIYWQIKKGKIIKSLSEKLLNKKEHQLIFSLYELVLNIQKLDLQLQKQELAIENQNILIKNRQDKYLHGVLDLSRLDEAIIDLNSLKNKKEEIYQARIDLIANLRDLTDLEYNEITIPEFEIIPEETFVEKNFDIDIQKTNIKNSELDKKLAYAQFLPKISVFGSYQYDDSEFQKINESTTYGVKLTIPIGFGFSNAIETAKATYLKTRSELNDKIETAHNLYKKIISKMESVKRKVANTQELLKSYESLYKTTKEYYESDLKTADDVKILENRVKINKLDLKIYEIELKNLKLLFYKNIS
jgi:outer membrane protein TolC